MKQILFVLLLIMIVFAGFGQKGKLIDSLTIKFLFPFSQVYDSSQLTLKVVYTNNTNKNISVYKELKEGYKGDRFFNIAIEMEKLEQKAYKFYPLRSYISAHASSLVDSLRHFDLPKKELAPYASDTLALDILKVANGFLPGKYRFRAHLRVKTIRDDREYNDPKFETLPPQDEVIYISSQWFYLTIKNDIQRQLKTFSPHSPNSPLPTTH
jgi:hypothetical protein